MDELVSPDGSHRDPNPLKLPRLSAKDIEALERVLGKPIADHKLEAVRLSRIIRDLAWLTIQPKRQDYRPQLREIARQGRTWLRTIEKFPAQPMLHDSNVEAMKTEVTRFCDLVDILRREHGKAFRTGPPRTRLLLQVFIRQLIGIAKRARVLPSTPSRIVLPERPPPPFFLFVKEALAMAWRLVRSSSLTQKQQQAASAIFSVGGDEALIKQIELVRGRIGDYRDSPHGLLEWPKAKD
jgi:hypothetical protein